MDRLLAQSRHHLGIVAAATGDLPAAIGWFDSADDVLAKLGVVDPHALFDRAQAFSNAGLGAEAMGSAAAAVRRLEVEGDALYLAEAQLVFAESALMLGRDREASEAAETARRAFVRQRRHGYAAMARFALLRARARDGADPQMLQEARRVAARLHSFRFVDPALDASLLAGQMALQLGRKRAARHELESVSVNRHRGTPLQRVKGWQAEALLRVAASRPASARSAARAGLTVLDEHRASLNATDLRVHAARHASDLAALGLRLAAARPSARALFDWMELTRAGAMRFTPVQPPDDELLASELAALRTVERNLRRAELEGRETGPAQREQARLQGAVRRRTRQAPGAEGRRTAPLRAGDALTVLDGWSLVELAAIDGLLHAVVLADGRARHTVLAPVTDVARELDALRAATRRMASPQISDSSRAAAWLVASNARRLLDEVLLAPLRLGNHPLVLVPPPVLQAVPWGSLGSLRGRPMVVSPSARIWYERRSSRTTTKRVVLASGPGLPQGGYETRALQRIWPSALRIGSKIATTEAVAAAMQGVSLAHLVCHGKFRADNPLFSSLEMADGALYVYDLERLRRPPETMVLSACDVGVPAERPGDEVLGVVATLLAGGTSTVIASVGLVPDAVVTRRLMVALHRRLAAGDCPAAALADALSGLDPDDPAALLASSFVCFGAG
jgi:tetratricopeptide (TPR) repeat protein